MYHPTVVSANLDRYLALSGVAPPTYHPVAYVETAVSHLNALYSPDSHQLTRALDPDEEAFIQNERILCRFDFNYYVERYAWCYIDDMRGNLRPLRRLWEPQLILLKRIAALELAQFLQVEAGAQRVEGICIMALKARQLGFSMLAQLFGFHRVNFYSGVRAVTGSVDEEKTQLLYVDRFRILHDKLPWFLKTSKKLDTIERGMLLDNDSRMQLQDATQTTGFAQGNQYDFGHLTEIASWPDPTQQIENHYFPTIPYSIRAMSLLEGTAQGIAKGGPLWWKTRFEAARQRNLDRWHAFFTPWYLESSKYSLPAPTGWEPSSQSIQHANLVEQTSEDLVGSRHVLSRDQLYWYERNRDSAKVKGTLNIFLANYCATPEEAFQHSGDATFSAEVIEELQSNVKRPVPYELVGPYTTSARLFSSDAPSAPKPFRVGSSLLHPVRLMPDEPVTDPRGLVLMYEQPIPGADYIIGADTANGIHDWHRLNRRVSDSARDNAVASVWRRTRRRLIQVAEYAAPVEQRAFAEIVNLLGRIYHTEGLEALLIMEVFPMGLACQEALVYSYGYSNLWQRRRWNVTAEAEIVSDAFGWESTSRSKLILSQHARELVNNKQLIIRSPHLLSELQTLETDPIKHTIAAADGTHDDRAIAALLAGIASFDPALDPDPEIRNSTPAVPAQQVSTVPYQAQDISYEEMMDLYEARFEAIALAASDDDDYTS